MLGTAGIRSHPHMQEKVSAEDFCCGLCRCEAACTWPWLTEGVSAPPLGLAALGAWGFWEESQKLGPGIAGAPWEL